MKPRVLLSIILGLLAAGESRSQVENRPALSLVRSGTVLGDNLLERLGAAAKSAGYHVEVADIRAQAGGIQLVLPGLVLTPAADYLQKPIRIPVVILIGRSERLSVSFRAITRPSDPLSEGSAVRIVLRQILDDKVVAHQTTKLVQGWTTPALDWVADRDWRAGELVVEIIPMFSGAVKITLPQGLLLPVIKK